MSAQRDAQSPPGKNFHKIISLVQRSVPGVSTSPRHGHLAHHRDGGGGGGEGRRWDLDHARLRPHPSPLKHSRRPGRRRRAVSSWGSKLRTGWPSWSDRASRDGSHKTYAMKVRDRPEDRPGRPAATDLNRRAGGRREVSPDGKWVAYPVPGEQAIKAVPSTGGACSYVGEDSRVWPPFTWSGDGKTLYFVFAWGPVRRHSASGTRSAPTAAPPCAHTRTSGDALRPEHRLHVIFAPRGDAERGGDKRVQLYDAKKRLVGRLTRPVT